MKSRRGVAVALIAGIALLFCMGIIWAIWYDGVLLPAKQASVSLFGTNIYQAQALAVMEYVGAFFGMIMTVSVVWWWWQKSQKVYLE